MYLSVDKIFMACIFYQDFLNRRLLLSRQLHSLRLLMVKLKYSLRKFYGRRHYFVRNVSVTGDHGCVSFVVVYSRDFHLYDLSSDFKITGVTSGACVVYTSGIPTFTMDLSRVCVTQSLDFCVLFYGQLLVFSSFFFPFGIWIVCVSNYGFCYVQTSRFLAEVFFWLEFYCSSCQTICTIQWTDE